jgi:hypothetical protein
MDLATAPVALRGEAQARSARGSTGDAITVRPDPFVTRTMTRASSDVHPCTTSSAIAVAYRAAPDQRPPT